MEYDLTEFRAGIADDLRHQGYKFASSLPFKKDLSLRPMIDIVRRLTAVKAVAFWVCQPEDGVPSATIEDCITRNGLKPYFSKKELPMIEAERTEALNLYSGDIGWSFEGAWSLAWILGFGDALPGIDGEMIDEEIIVELLRDFAPKLDEDLAGWLRKQVPRDEETIVGIEDFFYCVHNAARSAALGNPECVPDWFHPQIGCGVIQERRQGFTWALSPGIPWDDTDLST